jgi:predicted secreted protein
MFTDKRSKKILLVAHCILNQNAKIDRCAHYPGMIKGLLEIFADAGVGLIQMPCPELLYLGLNRQAEVGAPTTVEAEDTRVAGRMREDPAQTLCGKIVSDLTYQLEEYRKHGFALVGLVGINGSPTCGIETAWSNDQETPGPGVFIQRLKEELDKKGFSLTMRGIKAYQPPQTIAAVRELLGQA